MAGQREKGGRGTKAGAGARGTEPRGTSSSSRSRGTATHGAATHGAATHGTATHGTATRGAATHGAATRSTTTRGASAQRKPQADTGRRGKESGRAPGQAPGQESGVYRERKQSDAYAGKPGRGRQARHESGGERARGDSSYRPSGGAPDRAPDRMDRATRDAQHGMRHAVQQAVPDRAPAGVPQEQAPIPAQAYFLMGRNAVREAVKSGRSIDRILVIPEQDGSLREITGLAKERGVVIKSTSRAKLDELCMPYGHNGKPGNHQGIIAMVPEVEYASIPDILQVAQERNEPPFLLLLDEINDPHNLGSMLRSAVCAGVHGVVIPKRRAASVTAAVARASAGAVEHIKIAKVNNLTEAIRQLREEGLWIAGGDSEGTPMAEVDLTGPLALVIGNEGEGISRLVKENCDYLVRIPLRGPIGSLNASVAAAVLLFEKVRQEAAKG